MEGANIQARGHPLHTRSLTIVLRSGEDGTTHLRGDIIDLRKTGFVPMPDGLQTAGIIHQMVIDAHIDADHRLESLETQQPFVAVEPSQASAGECCRDPAPRLQALVGQRFDEDFAIALSRNFGGALGCSHLLTLFHLIASMLPPALAAENALLRESGAPREPGERFFRRSVFLDGHEPKKGSLQLAVQLSDFHSMPATAAVGRLGHLAGQHEVRASCDIVLSDVRIAELSAWERSRTRDTLASAEWRDISPEIAGFRGRPVMPGLGNALRGELGGHPERRRLLDTLLQLAPGFIQCMPTLTDSMISRMGAGSEGRAGGRSALPGFLSLGGATDSCYMWRAGGPLARVRMPLGSEDR